MFSPRRKAAFVVALVMASAALPAASALAQGNPGNPSGGTSMRQTTEEGTGVFSPSGFLFRNFLTGAGWQLSFGGFPASRLTFAVAGRATDGRSLLAVARRSMWKR